VQARIQGVCAVSPLTRNTTRAWKAHAMETMETAATMVGEGRGDSHRQWPPRERRRRWRPPTAASESLGMISGIFVAVLLLPMVVTHGVAVHDVFGCSLERSWRRVAHVKASAWWRHWRLSWWLLWMKFAVVEKAVAELPVVGDAASFKVCVGAVKVWRDGRDHGGKRG